MSATNLMLYRYIRSRNLSATARVEGTKHLVISIAFGVSYLYKGIWNTLYAGEAQVMYDFMQDQTIAWCVVFFGYIAIGELLPLALLFLY
jgi:hypothetical protein